MRFLILVIAGIALGGLAVLAYVSDYARPKWPKIDDPKALIREGRAIVAVQKTGPLEQSGWPASIKKLSPLGVTVSNGRYVEIVISGGGIGPSYSYIVFASDDLEPGFKMPEVELHKSKYSGIYQLY